MIPIADIVELLRANGVQSPEIPGDEWVLPMRFVSSLANDAAEETECDVVAGRPCPDDLRQFWRYARSAKLFEDTTYGQWGLEILDPRNAAEATRRFADARPHDVIKGDVIVARFIGDSELLLVRCDPPAADFGAVIVVAPIDPRADWDTVAKSFGEFLNRYVSARGDKYWMPRAEET